MLTHHPNAIHTQQAAPHNHGQLQRAKAAAAHSRDHPSHHPDLEIIIMSPTNPLAHPRDLKGYGRNPPDPKWPGGAKLAVQFVINYEEGGENCVLDGDR